MVSFFDSFSLGSFMKLQCLHHCHTAGELWQVHGLAAIVPPKQQPHHAAKKLWPAHGPATIGPQQQQIHRPAEEFQPVRGSARIGSVSLQRTAFQELFLDLF